ncbi:MAG: cyclic nucleotide-binding domain-containing protein, partial [Kiloniellales bacterium]|nr:cyclic nucleotide-binding domain-containing protein [Kiloniellales bacterium]
MQQLRFNAGETIFTEGDPSDLAYLIWSGRVEVSRQTPQGARRIAILSKDQFLGEMGVIDDQPRSATAKALEPTVCSAITKDEFVEMLLKRPEEAMDLLRVLFDRLRTANDSLVQLQSRSVFDDVPEVRIAIHPATAEMAQVIPEDGLQVNRLPFRIGRAPRNRASALLVVNELELPESTAFVISPNHLSLERDGQNVV